MIGKKTFTWIFIIILITELLVINIPSLSEFRIFSKSAIVVSLLLYVAFSKLIHQVKNLLFLALLFCLAGDNFLIYDGYFVFGLAAFLVGHVFYTILMFHRKQSISKGMMVLGLALLVHVAIMLSLIYPNLGELFPYVIAYMLVIMAMAISSFTTKEFYERNSFIKCFIGALSFVLSDSLLALNLFYEPFNGANSLVMATYGIAQYLLVTGICSASKNKIQQSGE